MMKRTNYILGSLVAIVSLFSCQSAARETPPPPVSAVEAPSKPAPSPAVEGPSPVQKPESSTIPPPPQESPVVPPDPAAEPFDPASITKEEYDSTKSDIQALIQELNTIIRTQNYNAWVDHLGPKYMAAISSPAFLARVSESARLKNQKIVLRDLKDYFMYVVVPSRANDRVDDIEFIGQNRVKAFTVTEKNQRLRLYDLEKTDQGWKIVN